MSKRTQKLEEISSAKIESERIHLLEFKVEQQNALLKLIRKVRGIFPHSFHAGKFISKTQRKNIVKAIQQALHWNLIKVCLKIMKRLILSHQYSHFSIPSLCLLAQREKELLCSLDSWYKYIRIFGWTRPREEQKKETPFKIGIRAKARNEIWHIDVTEDTTHNGKTIYIQIVYDNFSRYILAWQVTPQIGGRLTVELLQKTKTLVMEDKGVDDTKVIMDGGPENNNFSVLRFFTSHRLQRLITMVDINFSNSMAESLFRCLKSNFLNTEDIQNKSDVENKVSFYFNEHNEKIPKALFKGATPKEIYLNLWNQDCVAALKRNLFLARENRIKMFRSKSCTMCI